MHTHTHARTHARIRTRIHAHTKHNTDAGDQLQVGLSFVPNDIVPEGDTVQVVCNVTGVGPIMNITWLSNDNVIVENYRVDIHLDLGSRTSTLQISYLRFSDAGNYTCQAIIGGVTHSSSPGVLQVASRIIVEAFYVHAEGIRRWRGSCGLQCQLLSSSNTEMVQRQQ